MTNPYLAALDPLKIGDSQTWYSPANIEWHHHPLPGSDHGFAADDMVVINIGANDFAMTGNRFTKTTKRLTSRGWVGKTVYGHINKRGRQVVHRVVHHG